MKKVDVPMLGLSLVVFLAAATFEPISSLPSTVPAFLWSPHHRHRFSNNIEDKYVDYQTISPQELAKSVLYEGGWSKILCMGKEVEQHVDLAIIFIGSELQSDFMLSRQVDPNLMDLLKVSFSRSNFSMAFPYVAAPERGAIEKLLISEFKKSCGHDLRISNSAFQELSSVEDESFQKLPMLAHSINDYMVSRMEKKPEGETELVVFSHGDFSSPKEGNPWTSESKTLLEIMTSAEHVGAKYEILYISDPFRSIRHSYVELGRFMAEGSAGNGSAKSEDFCDEVCQIKSSLLEGLFVGIVLLIILLSGLCCMMGIDTPTRFETPQDS
ncbi:uncharacterized protein LOC120075692 [Benincasa hispida]|uniref:uncharacterized protein LOC120075692 n=1 Tax=Benincasa hispida TaxID=102211 RepID=UPI001901A29C|nr:uncharacterized protein LOC120075692 [Benincasa hispida]XP_038885230.1 uncharacterized protein LOC120075692 [Benincasa hispida]XP_038885231.1 uncharacterized protein LOC120075692 [Benincasa hispida]XP_038885232.1 uncharacterized protein LOC120075692 [Benincasa hispida]